VQRLPEADGVQLAFEMLRLRRRAERLIAWLFLVCMWGTFGWLSVGVLYLRMKGAL
jgi:hypothetical protein